MDSGCDSASALVRFVLFGIFQVFRFSPFSPSSVSWCRNVSLFRPFLLTFAGFWEGVVISFSFSPLRFSVFLPFFFLVVICVAFSFSDMVRGMIQCFRVRAWFFAPVLPLGSSAQSFVVLVRFADLS